MFFPFLSFWQLMQYDSVGFGVSGHVAPEVDMHSRDE